MSLKGIFPVDKWSFHSNTILDGLTDKEMAMLCAHMTDLHCKKGESIFKEGTTASGIYFIRKGKVKKYRVDKEGYEQIIYVANTGELIGYHGIVSGDNYPDSAASLEASLLSFIPKEDFLATIAYSARFNIQLLKAVSHEYQVLSNSISVMARHTVRERLAISLIILREKYKLPGQPGKQIVIDISRKDLASMTATTEENVVRLLKEFKQEGIVATEGRRIMVLDVTKLVKVTNYNK